MAFGKDEQEGHEIECPEPNLEGIIEHPHYCAYTDECQELGAPWCDALWGLA